MGMQQERTKRERKQIGDLIRTRFRLAPKSSAAGDVAEIDETLLPDWNFVRDGRFGFWESCIGPDPTTDNPYSFRQNQWQSLEACETYFDGVFSRVESFFGSVGYARVVFRSFPGVIDAINGNLGIFEPPSADNPTGPNIEFTGRVQAFLERAQQYKVATEGKGTVGFYSSGQVPVDLTVLEDDQSTADWERYDHDDLGHRRVVFHEMLQHTIDTMKPYDLYPDELWFDNTSPATWLTNAVKLMRHMRDQWGIHAGGEAIPIFLRNGRYFLDYASLQRSPWMALWRFIAQRDPNRKWVIPENAEIGLLMQDSSQFGNPTLTTMRQRVEQGMVLWSTQTTYDSMLQTIALENLPLAPVGGPYTPEDDFISNRDNDSPWDD